MSLFLSSFILGIAFCAPPGIITAETVRRGLSRGFLPALLVQFGSLFGDLTWAGISLTGAAFFLNNQLVHIGISFLGMTLLFILALKSLKDAYHYRPLEIERTTERSDLLTGVMLSLSNPYAIAFWAAASSTIFVSVEGSLQWYHFVIFYCAFLAGAILWCFFLASLVAWGRKYITFTFFRWVNVSCGVALLYFSFRLGMDLVNTFL